MRCSKHSDSSMVKHLSVIWVVQKLLHEDLFLFMSFALRISIKGKGSTSDTL